MQRNPLLIFSWGCVLIGACADPDCPPDQVKIGTVCHPRPRRDAGDSTDEAGDLDDDDRRRSTDAKGDAGIGVPADVSGGAATSDANTRPIDAATNANTSPASPSSEQEDAGTQRTEAPKTDASADPLKPSQGEDAGSSGTFDAGMPCTASAEVCDGKDNDCDGIVDEEQPTWYCDADGDGFAANTIDKKDSCDSPLATEICRGWTKTAPLGVGTQDCDDASALRFPGADFGLTVESISDLNCDGKTETKLEFVSSTIAGLYSSATIFNICEHSLIELYEGTAGGECECWVSTALSDGTGPSVPYYMNTFPCAAGRDEVISLTRFGMSGASCRQDQGLVTVSQRCR